MTAREIEQHFNLLTPAQAERPAIRREALMEAAKLVCPIHDDPRYVTEVNQFATRHRHKDQVGGGWNCPARDIYAAIAAEESQSARPSGAREG